MTNSEVKRIIESTIQRDEKLGEHVGGSGHHGYVSYRIDEVAEPMPVQTEKGEGWQITYTYTTIAETEFTRYPDHPPHKYRYRKKIVIDDRGDIIEESGKEPIKSYDNDCL